MCYILHGFTPGFYMIAFDIFAKVLAHGCIAVGALYALENNSGVFKGYMFYRCKITLAIDSVLGKQLILSFSADSHDLAEKFLYAKAVEISVSLAF